MLLENIEEVLHNVGQQVVCANVDNTEHPEYFTILEVKKATLVETEDRNGEPVSIVVCGKKVDRYENGSKPISAKSIRYIFFDPKEKIFKMNSFFGPRVALHTPFDYLEETDKGFVAMKRALIKRWYRGVMSNEKRREVPARSIQSEPAV